MSTSHVDEYFGAGGLLLKTYQKVLPYATSSWVNEVADLIVLIRFELLQHFTQRGWSVPSSAPAIPPLPGRHQTNTVPGRHGTGITQIRPLPFFSSSFTASVIAWAFSGSTQGHYLLRDTSKFVLASSDGFQDPTGSQLFDQCSIHFCAYDTALLSHFLDSRAPRATGLLLLWKVDYRGSWYSDLGVCLGFIKAVEYTGEKTLALPAPTSGRRAPSKKKWPPFLELEL